ncbi:MAG TPA: thioredoxin-like domain-containing protein, partial [Terriglobales bacterium]|nr:thioredoxin-like domain-containing protein [Terriglobales bacterium]
MNATIHAPELERSFAWLNTDRPLRFARELKGQVVLLDFWTFCCINCMHILPDLEHLERRFAGRPFLVIGVHSAKFENETARESVRAAIQRYGIRHPVVIDEDMKLWRAYGARSWPTRVLVDPTGRIALTYAGEGERERFERAIEGLLEEHARNGTLAASPIALRPEAAVRSASGLSFPGKVLADPPRAGEPGRLFIADTAHHRVVIAGWPDRSGRAPLLRAIGSGRAGREDGPAERASFRAPQGLALTRGRLFVADTENHLIRAVDPATGEVSTWAGTGEMTNDRAGGARGVRQGINSPWDLAVHGSRLLVAMAGTHQIWRFELGNAFGRAYAGTGREDLEDGPAERAALAQPSGLAVAGDTLWIADSEVSAIRGLDLVDERLFTVIGEGLFDFGDVDGAYPAARLQHPLGVAAWRERLLVADSYNHKIKLVDPAARTAATRFGDGRPGAGPGAEGGSGRGGLRLFEPGGLSVAGDEAFVADTNNHRLVRLDLEGGAWTEIAIEGLEPPAREEAAADAGEEIAPVRLRRGAPIMLIADGGVPAGAH